MNKLTNILIAILLASALSASAATLTRDDVVKMTRAGVNEDVIIQTIEANGANFSLSAPDIEALKKAGVSERVVAAMQKHRETVLPPAYGDTSSSEQTVRAEQVPSSEQVVRALPVTPPAVYYAAPPTVVYYDYGPYYYYRPYCYPPVGFSFSYSSRGFYHGRCR